MAFAALSFLYKYKILNLCPFPQFSDSFLSLNLWVDLVWFNSLLSLWREKTPEKYKPRPL